MSVGGVGAVGSAGVSAGHGSVPTGGPSSSEGVTSSSNGDASPKDISDAGDKAGASLNATQVQNNSMFINMSTQDSMELHNCVNKSSECGELDLQKLIEMMMAIKLLEALNDQPSGGGFSATA